MSPARRILVTAGPTREKIDPIRFISNLSTGFMGYEIARAAKSRGYKVTLISGPTNLVPPRGVDFISVESARQMSRAVKGALENSDCLFMASAVCDWRPAKGLATKLKRTNGALSLKLVKNPDILYGAGRRKRPRAKTRGSAEPSGFGRPKGSPPKAGKRKVLVGFALESADLEKRAKEKLREKNLDIVAANKIGRKKSPFGKGLTDVLIVTRTENCKRLKGVTKETVANYLIDKAEELW